MLWLLWNDSDIKIQVIAHSRHSITALAVDYKNIWVFTIVYANPCVTTRRSLWNYLDAIRNCFNLP